VISGKGYLVNFNKLEQVRNQMTRLNVGDLAHVKTQRNTKRIRVTGYWKFKRFSHIYDEFTRDILKRIIDNEIATGLRVKEERIEPCGQSEAHLIGTNHSFFDVKDVELTTPNEPIDAEFYQNEHAHKLSLMEQDGEMGLYGRIKLPVSNYPRFFDKSGELLAEYLK
jgi:hypothetical protein